MYRHTLVSKSDEADSTGKPSEDGYTHHNGNMVKHDEWAYWVDGYPVMKHVMELANEVRRVYPKMKFKVKRLPHESIFVYSEGDNNNRGPFLVFNFLWAYLPDCEYMVGGVGHGNFRVRGGSSCYVVYSRLLRNGAIHADREQHNMAFSDKLSVAVKKATQSLKRYTPIEYANITRNKFAQQIQSASTDRENLGRGVLQACLSLRVIEQEMPNFIRLGVSFVTPEFKKAAEHYMEAEAEATAEKLTKRSAYFIRIVPHPVTPDAQRAIVVTYHVNFKKTSTVGTGQTEVAEMDVQDLPIDIQLKLATLSTTSPDTYVPSVGMLTKDKSFWVERDAA